MKGSETGPTAAPITEVAYTTNFYQGYAPVQLDYVAGLNGFAVRSRHGGFTYLDLGCGQGYVTNVLAAANAHGTFYGVDVNSEHIANARGMADAAGLANVTFLEAAIAEANAADLPDFDMIAMHGIYSWVGAAERAAIQQLIRDRLKPGGIAYVSYNCLPGWSAEAPLRHLLLERQKQSDGPLKEQVNDTIAFVSSFAKGGGKFFEAGDTVRTAIETLETADPAYIAHEYFTPAWRLFHHADIVGDMAEAGLTFAGSAELPFNYDHLVLPEQVRGLVDHTVSPAFVEVLKDYQVNRRFRKDVFIRTTATLDPAARRRVLRESSFMLGVARDTLKLKKRFPQGEIDFERDLFAPVADTLADEPMTLEQILADGRLKQKGEEAVIGAVTMLVAAGRAVPVPSKADRNAAAQCDPNATDRLNHLLLQQAGGGATTTSLASFVSGTGYDADHLDCALLFAEREGRDPDEPARAAQQHMESERRRRGKEARSDADLRRRLTERLTKFEISRRAVYQRFGIA